MSHSDGAESESYLDSSAFYRLLATKSRVKIIDVLLRNPGANLSVSRICDAAEVDQSTFSRNKDILINLDIMSEVADDGPGSVYTVNVDSEVVQNLGRAHAELSKLEQYVPNHIDNIFSNLKNMAEQTEETVDSKADDGSIQEDTLRRFAEIGNRARSEG